MFTGNKIIRLGFTCLITVFLVAATAWAQPVIYVDDDAPNDPGPGDPSSSDPLENGTADHPFDAIQEGIDAAIVLYTEVVILPGTYTGSGNYDLSFNGLAITVRSENWDPAEVLIDCEGNGRGFLFVNDEDANWLIGGLTIANGYASGNSAPGGGIRCGMPGFPPITQPHFGSPSISSCVIRDCHAGYGGGLSCEEGSNPIVDNTTFENNTASVTLSQAFGGGAYVLESSPQFNGCRFYRNTVSGIAAAGGGVYLETSTSQLSYCRFADNEAPGNGGAVCANAAEPSIDHCTFHKNTAGVQGGGFYCYSQFTSPTLEYCTFYRNSAMNGSAVAAVYSAQITLRYSILCMGEAGVAAYCQDYGGVTITCCDAWGNVDGNGCIQSQLGSSNNFEEYPGFCDPLDPNYALTIRDTSPCAPANSPCGQQVGAWGVDCSGPLMHYVCPEGDSGSWYIQQALDAAQSGDTVVLCDTTYSGDGNRDLDYGGKDLVVQSEGGNPENCVINCGGSAAASHRGFYFHTGETAAAELIGVRITNGYNTDWPGGGAILCTDGAVPTISNCILDYNHTDYEGGGLCARAVTPNVSDCRFEFNTSVGIGGGMIVSGEGTSSISDCWFSDNAADDDGGGLAAFSPVVVSDTTFRQNHTGARGGGVTVMDDADGSRFTRCMFMQNDASGAAWNAGGGLSSFVDSLTFEECTFYENTTVNDGGGVYSATGTQTFNNCTLTNNAAATGGGVWGGGTFDHTIITFSGLGEAVIGPATANCCDVYGNYGGPGSLAALIGINGNFAADPIYCDVAAQDLTIRDDSPCTAYNSPAQCGLVGAWPVGCCYADLDGDGVVGLADLQILLANYGSTGVGPDEGDFDGDGDVDLADLQLLLSVYGTTCG